MLVNLCTVDSNNDDDLMYRNNVEYVKDVQIAKGIPEPIGSSYSFCKQG